MIYYVCDIERCTGLKNVVFKTRKQSFNKITH